MMLWIENALSPQDVRDRLMDQDSEFQKNIIAYLEGVHQGEFMTGSMEEVKTRVPYVPEDNGWHKVWSEADDRVLNSGYIDPTQTLPEPPPPICESSHATSDACSSCYELTTWWQRFRYTVDDILLQSNVHTCQSKDPSKDNKASEAERKLKQSKGGAKGCLNKEGVCTARFPREIVPESTVDHDDGRITLKSWRNV
ncbi:hypothetical protein BKA70DRAFT_1110691 [Coprinopsis sp. MPI-PUGE-AT-0042]|nr:hypothetical protein BKA70DRAFT_1110691 [Coprinopsis sp. MPI-PUGE-AT-0042]